MNEKRFPIHYQLEKAIGKRYWWWTMAGVGTNLKWDSTEGHIEAQIYSQTYLFLDPRLQKSKYSSNYIRSSKQQDTLAQALGSFQYWILL